MSRLQQLQAFLEQDPNDSFTHYAIGLEYASQKDYPKAIETLEALRAKSPSYVPLYYMLAEYYRKTKAPEQARMIYHEGMRVAKQERDLHAVSELERALDELEDELS